MVANNICALVVTYKRPQLLKECLDAIKNQSYECDIFVINNCSHDVTEKYLVDNNIPFYSSDKNIGGAGGFNIGIRKVIEKGYDFIWLMDDDCIPNYNALEKLIEADKKIGPKYGFLVSKAVWIDGEAHQMNSIRNSKETAMEHISLIKQATFVSLFLKRETVIKCGLPIKDFFIWGDDIEYTRRITVINKMPAYYIDNSVVTHKTENNVGSKIAYDDISKIERYIFAYRNEAFLYRKEGFMGSVYYSLKCIFNFLRICLFSKNNKTLRIITLFRGIKAGFSFSPSIEYL